MEMDTDVPSVPRGRSQPCHPRFADFRICDPRMICFLENGRMLAAWSMTEHVYLIQGRLCMMSC